MNPTNPSWPAALFSRRLWRLGAISYGLLSGVDLLLTWLLVGHWGDAHEANPLAAAVLQGCGWWGLIVFKVTLVVLVVGISRHIFRPRPRTAGLLLGLGCLMAGGVVAYSVTLVTQGREEENGGLALEQEELQMRRLRDLEYYQQQVAAQADKIFHGQQTLAQAVAELEKVRDELFHDPLAPWQGIGGLKDEALMAGQLVRAVGLKVAGDPGQARRYYDALVQEFAAYETPLPEFARVAFHGDAIVPAEEQQPFTAFDGPSPDARVAKREDSAVPTKEMVTDLAGIGVQKLDQAADQKTASVAGPRNASAKSRDWLPRCYGREDSTAPHRVSAARGGPGRPHAFSSRGGRGFFRGDFIRHC